MNLKGNPGGRPKGSRNKTSLEIADFARKILQSREYQSSLKRRLVDGTAPQLEILMHHYAFGKPIERLQIIAPVLTEINRLADLYGMTAAEVLAEAEAISQGRDR